MRCSSFLPFRPGRLSLDRFLGSCLLVLALGLIPCAAMAQAGAAPGDTKTETPAQDNPAPPVPAPDLTKIPTLVPMVGDPPEAEEVVIPAKPVVILSGESSWDDSVVNLKNAFAQIEEFLAKEGRKSSGRPLAVFTKTTDDGFSFDAMIPLAEASAADQLPPAGNIRFGTVPAGKALRFIHREPYEQISMTYEGIALYMETKDLISKDAFIEEYVSDITDQADKGLVVNIYVELKDKE